MHTCCCFKYPCIYSMIYAGANCYPHVTVVLLLCYLYLHTGSRFFNAMWQKYKLTEHVRWNKSRELWWPDIITVNFHNNVNNNMTTDWPISLLMFLVRHFDWDEFTCISKILISTTKFTHNSFNRSHSHSCFALQVSIPQLKTVLIQVNFAIQQFYHNFFVHQTSVKLV
jgi:hypothetical protein